jgi:hypothetical protein
MQISGNLYNELRPTLSLEHSKNEDYLGLPESIWFKIVRMVCHEKNHAENFSLASKRFHSMAKWAPHSLEKLFRVARSVQVSLPKQLERSLPHISTTVENGVVFRQSSQELHIYDTKNGASAYVRLSRDSIQSVYYSGAEKNLSIIGRKKNYCVNFDDNECQAIEITRDKSQKRSSSPSGKAKTRKLDDTGLGFDPILLDYFTLSRTIGNSIDVMDLFFHIANALGSNKPSLVSTFNLTKDKRVNCYEDGLVEIKAANTNELIKAFTLAQRESKIVDIVAFSCFLAVLRENSKRIDIVDIVSERVLHTFVAKSTVDSLFFENGQLSACLKNGTVEIWGSSEKAPAKTLEFEFNSITNENRKKKKYKESEKTPLDLWEIEHDNCWLNRFVETSKVIELS